MRGLIARLLCMPKEARRSGMLNVELSAERRERGVRAFCKDRQDRRARGETFPADETHDEDAFDDDHLDAWQAPVTDEELLEAAQLFVTLLTVMDGPVNLKLACYPDHLPLLAASPDVSAALCGGHIAFELYNGRMNQRTCSGDIVEAARSISIIAAEAESVYLDAQLWFEDDEVADAVAAAVPMRASTFSHCKGPEALVNALAFRMSRLSSAGPGILHALDDLAPHQRDAFDYGGRIESLEIDEGGQYPILVTLKNLNHIRYTSHEDVWFSALPAGFETLAWTSGQRPAALRSLLTRLPASSRLRRLTGRLRRDSTMSDAYSQLLGFPYLGEAPAVTQARFDHELACLRAECVSRDIALDCTVP